MTQTMRRVAMLIGLAIVTVPMALFVLNASVHYLGIAMFVVATIVATFALWLLIFGGGFSKTVRIRMPIVAIFVLASAWLGATNFPTNQLSADEAATAHGYYTDKIVITSDCRVVEPGTTGIAISSIPDDLGRGCKVEVAASDNDLYIPADAPGMPVDGNYASDSRTYVFVSSASTITVYAYNREYFARALLAPSEAVWGSTIVGRLPKTWPTS
jgi:hypothetical protein